MRTTPRGSEAGPARSTPVDPKPADIASVPIPDTLAALHVDPDTGLTHAEVDARRAEHGYNEVAEHKRTPDPQVPRQVLGHVGLDARADHGPVGRSSASTRISLVVGALLVVNAVLSFAQEHRAAGVVETLRRRLQVSARVLREASWQVIPARELVPGDIVRVRPGDIIPADVEAPDRGAERRPVGAHRRVEGCRQGARRRALVGVRRPPGRRQRRGHADRGEDLLRPHHGTGAAGAAASSTSRRWWPRSSAGSSSSSARCWAW